MSSKLYSITFATVALIAFLSMTASASSDVSSCQILSVPNTEYVLTSDLFSNSNDSCLSITAEHITLNLNSKTITGNNTGIGIQSNSNYVTIKNGKVQNFDKAILLSSVSHNTLTNLALSNSRYGAKLDYSNSNNITNNTLARNSEGLSLQTSHDNSITKNTFESSILGEINYGHGVQFSDSNRNTFTDNTARNNGRDGIYVSTSNFNTIKNNEFINNSQYGIQLTVSNNNTIANNKVNNNKVGGIYLIFNSDHNTITSNQADKNGEFYSNLTSPQNTEKGSQGYLRDNTYCGLRLAEKSNNNIISSLTVTNTPQYSLCILDSSNNVFNDITLSNSLNGVYIASQNQNTSSNNTFSKLKTIAMTNSSIYMLALHTSKNLLNTFIDSEIQSETLAQDSEAMNQLVKSWSFLAIVEDNGDKRVEGAVITVKPSVSAEAIIPSVFTVNTNSEGTALIILPEYSKTNSQTLNFNPYKITASKDNEEDSAELTINKTTTHLFSLDLDGTSSGDDSKTFSPSSSQLEDGYKKTLIEDDEVKIKFNGKTYKITVTSINKDSIKIKITPTGITETIDEDDSSSFDLDEDGEDDISIEVIDITDSTEAKVLITLLAQDQTPKTTPTPEKTPSNDDTIPQILTSPSTTTQKTASLSLLFIILIISIIILIILIIIVALTR